MVVYNLEESPDVYITPRYNVNKFVYRMARIFGEVNRTIIRNIDLRNDKLMIYGTEINQSALHRLHESLILRPNKAGTLYVNCRGACYFVVPGKGCYRPINNVIFDWSIFGVAVPDSTHDSLRKQLEQKQKEIDQVDVLKEQLSACQKDKEDMEMELRKVRDQLSLVDFELETNKIELESSKKDVKELQDQLSTCRIERQNMEAELQKARDQISTINLELDCTKKSLESSNMSINELEHQLSSTRDEKQDLERELQTLHDELSSIKVELCSTESQLESSNKLVKELEEQLRTCGNDGQHLKMELGKVQNQLTLAKDELQSTKNQLESCEKQMQELKGQPCTCKRQHLYMGEELQQVSSHVSSIGSQVKSTVQKLHQLLISMMWNELHGCNHSDQPRLSSMILNTPPQGTGSGDSMNNLTISVTIEEDVR